MFFSIITAVYNAEKTIAKCIESVKRQAFLDYELLLVDDGSSDMSGEICKTMAADDSRIRYFFHENKGVSATRNRGIAEALGEYIVFLDSDDAYAPDYLQRFHSLIIQHTDCSSFCCGYRSFDENGVVTGQKLFDETAAVSLLDRSCFMELYDQFLFAQIWNKAFRSSTIRKTVLRMPDDLSLGEDLLFNLLYLDACGSTDIVIMNEPLYNYFAGSEQSLNRKYRPDLDSIYECLSEKLAFYSEKWNASDDGKKRCCNAIYSMLFRAAENYFHRMNKMSNKEKYRSAGSIIKSRAFKDAVKGSDCYINPIHRIAFRLNDFKLVRIMDKLAAAKNKIKKGAR